MNEKIKRHTINAVAAAGIALAFALLALAFTDLTNLWYIDLEKPAFLPSDDILIACWMAAVITSAIALYLCFTFGGIKGRAVYTYILCIALSAMWHYVFFQGGFIVHGFYTLAIAIVVAVYACYCMFKRHVAAGILSLPLPIWLCFLATLNYMLFMLN